MKKVYLIIAFLILFSQISVAANLLTFNDLIDATYDWLGLTDSTVDDFYPAGRVKDAINYACQWLVAINILYIEKFDTIKTVSDQMFYNLNSDFLQEKAVYKKSGNELKQQWYVDPTQVKQKEPQVESYTIWGNDTLSQFVPLPISLVSTDTFYIWYFARPKFLTTTDTVVNISQPMRTMIPLISAAFLLMWEGSNTRATELLKLAPIDFNRLEFFTNKRPSEGVIKP